MRLFGAFMGKWVYLALVFGGASCGGESSERMTLTLHELDRAHQCYRCQEPCYRRFTVWKSPEEGYQKCLKDCGERHEVDPKLCGIAHPETFRGWTDEPMGP